MKVCIVTNWPLDSYTVQVMRMAALKHDSTVEVWSIDDMALVIHNEGVHVTHNGLEAVGFDAFVTLVDEHCPQYEAILDALPYCCKYVVNSGEVHRDTFDELCLFRTLQSVQLKFPTTIAVTNIKKLDEAVKAFEGINGHSFPVLVRTLVNSNANGLVRADSMATLRTLVELLLEDEKPFALQEYMHHRRSYTAYVFGGEALAASVCKIGEDEDEFRTCLPGSLATLVRLEDDDAAALARLSNGIGRALIEVCFIKGPLGDPIILDVRPYVCFEMLNHSTGAVVAETVATKFFERLAALVEPPVEEVPTVEPETTAVPTSPAFEPPKPEPTHLSVIIHPLNDDSPVNAKLQSVEERNTIFVNDLKVDDNYIGFQFGGYRYRLPRREGIESASDTKNSFHNVPLSVTYGKVHALLLFTLVSGDTEHMGEIWLNSEEAGKVLMPPEAKPELKLEPAKEPEPVPAATAPAQPPPPPPSPAQTIPDIPITLPASTPARELATSDIPA